MQKTRTLERLKGAPPGSSKPLKGWATRQYCGGKILMVSISLLLVRLIIRVEVKAVGQPISFRMRAAACLLRDRGAWRLFHEDTSVLFHTDGRGMAMPEN